MHAGKRMTGTNKRASRVNTKSVHDEAAPESLLPPYPKPETQHPQKRSIPGSRSYDSHVEALNPAPRSQGCSEHNFLAHLQSRHTAKKEFL